MITHFYYVTQRLAISLLLGVVSSTVARGAEQWEGLYQSAQEYFLSSGHLREEAVRRFEGVLATSPPREVVLKCKLAIAGMYSCLFDPEKGETENDDEAIRILEEVVSDYADLPNRYCIMHAKINLGDLYCFKDRHERSGKGKLKAEPLYWQVIEVPEEAIILEDNLSQYNLDAIAVAKPRIARLEQGADGVIREQVIPEEVIEKVTREYRERLLKQRKFHIDILRAAAVRAVAYKQYVVGLPELSLANLELLKKKRPDDATFQKTVDSVIQEFLESHPDLKEEIMSR